MYRLVKFAIVGLAVIAPVSASIVAAKTPKLARCDGKSRRPANVHGSILPSVDPANGTVVPATARQGSVDVFPQADPTKANPRGSSPDEKPVPLVPEISATTPPSDYRSC